MSERRGSNVGSARRQRVVRALTGLVAVATIAGIVAFAVTLFRGTFDDGVPVTVLSPRAGLVLNPDAKVKLHGVEVGRVTRITARSDGLAAIEIDISRSYVHLVPSNVVVDIASSTVFGAKSIELVDPEKPSPSAISAGQILDARHVMVEINTVFQQLSSLLAKIQPDKLNETLSALASAFSGRGYKIGQAVTDFDEFLSAVEPALPALSHELSFAPAVFNAYADAAPDLMTIFDNATHISRTVVDERQHLDALLLSAIGMAQIGNPVLRDNRQALTDALHLLLPTTDLTNEYHDALTCQVKGMITMARADPSPVPGVQVLAGLTAGQERYRYPGDLPKVAAKGGPHCEDLPLPFEGRPRWVVANTGSNPWKYGNQQVVLNSDRLKQWLFGPIDGPPRNTAEIGHPG